VRQLVGGRKGRCLRHAGCARQPRTFLNPAPLDFFVDFNRDKRVNAIDMLIARDNPTTFINALKLITVPGKKSDDLDGVWAARIDAAAAARAPAVDAAGERLGQKAEKPAQQSVAPAVLDWLYEYEPGSAKPARAAAQEAVDKVLATLGS